MKKIIFLTMFLFLSFSAYSQITSTQNGNWSATTTWAGGSVPGASDAVVIAHDVTCASAQSASTLTVNSGKTLTVTKDGQLTVEGAVSNSGTLLVVSDENESGTNELDGDDLKQNIENTNNSSEDIPIETTEDKIENSSDDEKKLDLL